jgi:hypothetical protein
MNRVVTKIAAATSAARKIAAVSLAGSNRAVPHNVASTIAHRRRPLPPRPAASRKSRSFSRANRSPNIVASLWLLLRLQLLSRKFTSRNQISKTQLHALQVIFLVPLCLPLDQPVPPFPAVSPAAFPAGSSPTLARNLKLPPSLPTKISALPKTLRCQPMARIRPGMKLLRSNRPYPLAQILWPRAATPT